MFVIRNFLFEAKLFNFPVLCLFQLENKKNMEENCNLSYRKKSYSTLCRVFRNLETPPHPTENRYMGRTPIKKTYFIKVTTTKDIEVDISSDYFSNLSLPQMFLLTFLILHSNKKVLWVGPSNFYLLEKKNSFFVDSINIDCFFIFLNLSLAMFLRCS